MRLSEKSSEGRTRQATLMPVREIIVAEEKEYVLQILSEKERERESVCVALVIQHAMRMLHIRYPSMVRLAPRYISNID
jgi:hypothetical protein